ncbi:hypothetical protein ACFLXO_04685 [Chloroflexota bacterium]
MAGIKIEPLRAKRKLDGQEYILSKIDYTKEDAENDQAYYKGRKIEAKILEEDGYWLVYTKISQ